MGYADFMRRVCFDLPHCRVVSVKKADNKSLGCFIEEIDAQYKHYLQPEKGRLTLTLNNIISKRELRTCENGFN